MNGSHFNVRAWVPSEGQERPTEPNHFADFSFVAERDAIQKAATDHIHEMEIMSELHMTVDKNLLVLVETPDGVQHKVEVALVIRRQFVGCWLPYTAVRVHPCKEGQDPETGQTFIEEIQDGETPDCYGVYLRTSAGQLEWVTDFENPTTALEYAQFLMIDKSLPLVENPYSLPDGPLPDGFDAIDAANDAAENPPLDDNLPDHEDIPFTDGVA